MFCTQEVKRVPVSPGIGRHLMGLFWHNLPKELKDRLNQTLACRYFGAEIVLFGYSVVQTFACSSILCFA